MYASRYKQKSSKMEIYWLFTLNNLKNKQDLIYPHIYTYTYNVYSVHVYLYSKDSIPSKCTAGYIYIYIYTCHGHLITVIHGMFKLV